MARRAISTGMATLTCSVAASRAIPLAESGSISSGKQRAWYPLLGAGLARLGGAALAALLGTDAPGLLSNDHMPRNGGLQDKQERWLKYRPELLAGACGRGIQGA